MACLRNSEGYIDLTAYIAHKNIERQERSTPPMAELAKAAPPIVMKGDIWFVEKFNTTGSEQSSGRPAIIVSNDMNNACSSVVEVVYLTTQPKNDLPTHVTIRSMGKPSTALCEQITSVYIDRLGKFYGKVTDEELAKIDIAMQVSLGIDARHESGADQAGSDPNPSMVEDLAAAHKEIDRLQKLVDDLMNERHALTDTNIELNGVIESQKLSIGEMEEALEEKDQEIFELQGENVELSGRLDVVGNNYNELSAQYHKLTEQFDALTRKSAEISIELANCKKAEPPYPAYDANLRKAETAALVNKAKFELVREMYSEIVARIGFYAYEGGGDHD